MSELGLDGSDQEDTEIAVNQLYSSIGGVRLPSTAVDDNDDEAKHLTSSKW